MIRRKTGPPDAAEGWASGFRFKDAWPVHGVLRRPEASQQFIKRPLFTSNTLSPAFSASCTSCLCSASTRREHSIAELSRAGQPWARPQCCALAGSHHRSEPQHLPHVHSRGHAVQQRAHKCVPGSRCIDHCLLRDARHSSSGFGPRMTRVCCLLGSHATADYMHRKYAG